ncbi:hypothetical protein EKO23_01100 [Nocardioides guangzhouensis]|uniref:Uncharacterized protein n=1 Tax=Nocardioides guangzhouensis TaxID=2497878 RepID=A0A4Q4ZNI8_9ACTN|nr:hypothetical protein [Nocardioides guangzhouensis]RYP89054.1 hypothetical protein EKO23_01100 [Nocardioides guangzhouensis]
MSIQIQPRVVLADDFTPQRVYVPLAAKFDAAGAAECTLCHVDRYSTGEAGGIGSQVGRSTRLHAEDPDVRQYLAIPQEAFDPARPEVGAQHGVVHLYLTDIHPSVVVDEYVGAIVRCGKTLFLRLSTSSTQRQIKRYDSADSNAFTVLVVALLNHTAANLTGLRWSDDPRRAGRETPNWQEITSRAAELGKHLTFGQKTYDPQSEHLLLSLLGSMNQQDDITRIHSLTGGRVQKLLTSACPISEGQLPHGIRHKRRDDGRVFLGNKKTKYAEIDAEWHPAIVEALRLHAAGHPYVQIGLDVLVKHRVPRRGQFSTPGATYADLADLRADLSDATKTFFVNSNRTKPDEEHLYLGKLAVWETGRYPHRVANNLKQRGIPVGGLVPTYTGPDDVTGYFDVELDWGTALIGFKDEEERAAVLGACRDRLRAERRAPRAVAGREAAGGDVRALGGPYDRWEAIEPADQHWPGEVTMYGVTTRTHNSGKNTFILVRYPGSTSTDANGRPHGLMRYASKPAEHVAGTWSSEAYCASVATEIQRVVEDRILDPAAVVPVLAVAKNAGSPEGDRRRRNLVARLDAAAAKAAQLREDAEGLELLAARKERAGDQEAADRYDERAAQATAEAAKQDAIGADAAAALERLAREPATGPEPLEANLSLAAYLQSGLNRASLNNGRSSSAFSAVARNHLVQRRFKIRDEQVVWSADLLLPLVAGGELRIPLTGAVQNIRHRKGKELVRAEVVAEYVLRDGRTLDEVAIQQTATRKTVLVKRLMPWLVEYGVTARGAKNALVDHPLRLVQRIMHEQLTEGPNAFSSRWSAGFVGLLREVYCDSDLQWGDAACPDDTTWIATAVATVTQSTGTRKYGVPILDLALALGRTEDEVRELVTPQKRTGGFTRPRYLTYADKAKTKVKAIGCPHGRCRGRRHADHVALLPEVAASGYGVICSYCRRVPSDSRRWVSLQFPVEYLEHWTNRGPAGSLRAKAQTVPAQPPTTLALGVRCPEGISPSGDTDALLSNHDCRR